MKILGRLAFVPTVSGLVSLASLLVSDDLRTGVRNEIAERVCPFVNKEKAFCDDLDQFLA